MSLSESEAKRVEYLVQKLTNFKIRVEKLGQYLSGISVNPSNAKSRLDFLTTLYEAAVKYNDELVLVQPDNPAVDQFEETEARYYEISASINDLLRSQPLANSTLNSSNITITERQDLPKLPEIKLPVFDGQQKNWAIFKNKFITLVHSRTDLSDAVKCSQLFDSLKDHALAKISQFDPSEKDYQKAWKTLLDFYDHKRIVAMEHLHAITHLPQCSKASVEDLSRLLDKARQHLHILEGLGGSGDDVVVHLVESALPISVRNKWHDQLDMDTLPKLEDLFKFIQSSIFKHQTYEHSSIINRANNLKKRAGDSLPQTSNKVAKATARTLVTSTVVSSSQDDSPSACPKCNELHRLFKCPIFNSLSVQERWNFVKNTKACKNCLWVHPFPCKSQNRCKKCKQNHHTLLHNDKGTPQPRSRDSTPAPT